MQVGVFAYTSDEVNLFAVAEVMAQKGWHIDSQQRPNSLHAMITPAHTPKVVSEYLADLAASVEEVRNDPNADKKGSAPIYGMIATAPDRAMISDFILEMMDTLYSA